MGIGEISSTQMRGTGGYNHPADDLWFKMKKPPPLAQRHPLLDFISTPPKIAGIEV